MDDAIIMSSLPSLCMSPSSVSLSMEAKEGFCVSQEGLSSGNVAILGATGLQDFAFLERFDATTVESSLFRELLPAEDNPPIGVPLVVPRLLDLTFEMWRRCNKFSGSRKENPDHCCRYSDSSLSSKHRWSMKLTGSTLCWESSAWSWRTFWQNRM